MYDKLKLLLDEVKGHTDLTHKSIPFYEKIVREIRVELLKLTTAQGEQISRDVSDAMRLITISQREDLSNIQSYPREIPKYLKRVRDAIISSLAFVAR